MSDPTPASAQWLADPSGRHELRYWDGAAWTEHVADSGTQSVEPWDGTVAVGADESESSGRGKFGDGVSAPLYEFQASRFKGGRLITPNVIRVWPDRVEEYEHHALLKKHTKAINFAQVAQVGIGRGLVWTDITVESAGGHVIRLHGVPKDDAQRVKELIDRKAHEARTGAVSVGTTQSAATTTDVAAQIRELGKLRDEGLLTDDEFAAHKAKLLG